MPTQITFSQDEVATLLASLEGTAEKICREVGIVKEVREIIILAEKIRNACN